MESQVICAKSRIILNEDPRKGETEEGDDW